MQFSLNVSKSYGTTATATSLAALDSTIAYAAGAGVSIISEVSNEFSYNVCAPKQLKNEGSAAQLGSMNADSKAALRLNQVSCVALSERCVAVGETGHCPRVVIFARNSNKIIATMQEHQFGVHLMKFSPSGDLLATLGTPNDGYLYVWHTRPKVSVAVSNRCISEVSAMCWLSETTLVTAGVRHLRVWTVGDGAVLAGRNIVLGDIANSRFTALLPGSNGEFYVGNELGQVYKVSNSRLELVIETKEPVQTLAHANKTNQVVVASPLSIRFYDNFNLVETVEHPNQAFVSAQSLVCLSNGSIQKLDGTKLSGPCYQGISRTANGFIAWDDTILTYFDGNSSRDVPLSGYPSSVIVIDNQIATAYENGVVKLGSNEYIAHEADGAPIRLDQGHGWIISAGRDSLQIYTSEEQYQTLSLHGRVTKAKVIDAETLVATATNKVLNIVKLDAAKTFVVMRSIPSTSPIQDFTVHNNQLWISTLDKKLSIYDMEGQLVESHQTVDMLGEPVVVTNLNVFVQGENTFLVASASDKSIIVYNKEMTVAACQWAHSELPSQVLVVGEKIVSVARDGLFIYELNQLPESPTPSRSASPVRIHRPPSPTRQLRSVRSVGVLRSKSPERVLRSPEPRPTRISRSPPRSPPRSSPVRPVRKLLRPDALKLAPPEGGEPTDRQTPEAQAPPLASGLGDPFDSKEISSMPAQAKPSSAPAPASAPAAAAAASTSTTARSTSPTRNNLSISLRQYLDIGTPDATLFPLLVKALEKTNDKRALKYYSKKLADHFDT